MYIQMSSFSAHPPTGQAVQELEGLVRTAIFKPATALIAFLLQVAADRIDAAYQPKPGDVRKGAASINVQCLFGTFPRQRVYDYQPGKDFGYYPADARLGLETGFTPALSQVVYLEGAPVPIGTPVLVWLDSLCGLSLGTDIQPPARISYAAAKGLPRASRGLTALPALRAKDKLRQMLE